ncbi:hypothetical protein ACLOJK_023651 [Asimina triloba]
MLQSAAFKILKTRLKTVPSSALSTEPSNRTASVNPDTQMLNHMPSAQIMEDGDRNQDAGNVHNGINFLDKLQQFALMQQLHRLHARSPSQQRNSTSSNVSQKYQRPEEQRRPSAVTDISRPPSRSSWRSSGQIQP